MFEDAGATRRRRTLVKAASVVIALITVISVLAGSFLPFLER